MRKLIPFALIAVGVLAIGHTLFWNESRKIVEQEANKVDELRRTLATAPGGELATPETWNTDSLGRQVPGWVTNDAELLFYRCGQPDRDESSANEKPRPLIPTRWLEYKRAHLKFAYIPASVKMGDPPPYKWDLIGVIDTSTNTAVSAERFSDILRKRLPCYF